MRVQCTCSACGKTYEREPSKAGKYCSWSCFNSRPRKGIPDDERFWQNVDRSGGPDACWPWTAHTDQRGRGLFRMGGGGKKVNAARYAWELAHGPIPDGLCLLHRCDQPGCCNDAHHWLGTQTENIADRQAKSRQARGDAHGFRLRPELAPRGERHGSARLTADQVREIRRRRAETDVTLRELAAEFGVSSAAVHGVVCRRTWRHLD